jgi:acetyl-CoA carboxylase, biotin carboxylase subunit
LPRWLAVGRSGGCKLPGVFDSVLVANRGEIARRVIATARRLGIRSIAVYSEADADLPFAREADEAVLIGPAPPAGSYLNQPAVLAAARQTGASAIHPGYGFLAENPEFAARVLDAGLVWVGPRPASMQAMADKINARNLMERAGVPVSPGTREPVTDAAAALAAAEQVGYPVMIKAAAGGGGIGMSAAANPAQLTAGFETARSRAERFFGSADILLERFVERARHVEVQILGLPPGSGPSVPGVSPEGAVAPRAGPRGSGGPTPRAGPRGSGGPAPRASTVGQVLALGERDCSVQRRHQKVAEETPSPGVGAELREKMLTAAAQAGQAVGYLGAGTVEFLVDVASGGFVFLEMNTRLQVEHPVTELVTGIDLVEQQFLIASDEDVSFNPDQLTPDGHALELRIYAEDSKRFLPSPGTISEWVQPTGPGVRVDAGYAAGNVVTPFYDPLLAKLCVHGASRAEALEAARAAVRSFRIEGVKTNLQFHADLLESAEFCSGDYDTSLVARLRP